MQKLTHCLAAALGLLLTAPVARAQAPAWRVDAQLPSSNTAINQADVLASDAAGDLYIAGLFKGQLTLGGQTLTNRGYMDLFIAKWSPLTQSFVWAEQASSASYVTPRKIVVRGSDVYVAGDFNYTATIGGSTLVSAGQEDAFVAKLSDQGSSAVWRWATGGGGPQHDQVTDLVVSGSTVYAAGYFNGAATFGSSSLSSAGPADGFLLALNDQGSTVGQRWAQALGGTDYVYANALALSGGAVYVAGSFTQVMALSSSLTLTSAGSSDAFVARFTDTGSGPQWGWATPAGGADADGALALCARGSSLYLAGGFSSTAAAFGSSTLTATPVASTMRVLYPDGYVAKLTDTGAAGVFDWARPLGGPGEDVVKGLAAQGSNLYLTGYFSGAADFGGTTLNSGNARADVFLAKVSDAGSTGSVSWAAPAGGSGTDISYALALAGGRAYVSSKVGAPANFGSTVVNNPNGNSASVSVLASVQDQALATASAASPAGLLLTPNPAHGTATLTLPAGAAAEDALLSLTDVLGRPVRPRVAARPLGTGRYALDLGGLPAGTYLVQVQTGSSRAVRRLVVE